MGASLGKRRYLTGQQDFEREARRACRGTGFTTGSQGSGQGTPLPLLFFESRKRDGFPGTVFQKDLGPKTAKLVRKINSFSPDDTWTKVDAIQ
jgi:hypothetical protein